MKQADGQPGFAISDLVMYRCPYCRFIITETIMDAMKEGLMHNRLCRCKRSSWMAYEKIVFEALDDSYTLKEGNDERDDSG